MKIFGRNKGSKAVEIIELYFKEKYGIEVVDL